MKNVTLSSFLMILLFLSTTQIQAQTKKDLKAENEQLKPANTILQQRVQALEKEKKQLFHKVFQRINFGHL